MGVIITGLSIGLTLGIVLTPPLIQLGDSVFGTEGAWRMPFFVWGVISLAVGYGISRFFKGQRERDFNPSYLPALRDLGKYSLVFLVAIMAVYIAATQAGLPEWAVAVLIVVLALALVGFVFGRKGGEVSPILYDRDLLLIYISAIAILWNLWFFSFWSVSIVS
jgi:MFS transporter, ACS family, D-galactonate transporter